MSDIPNLTLVLETVSGETRRLRIRPHPDRHVAALLREDREVDEEWAHQGAEQLRRVEIEELGVEITAEGTEVTGP